MMLNFASVLFRLNMTEKLFTGTLNHNQNKKTKKHQCYCNKICSKGLEAVNVCWCNSTIVTVTFGLRLQCLLTVISFPNGHIINVRSRLDA